MTNDQTRILAGAAAGAVAGALAAYLVVTPRGRRLTNGINPALDDLLELLQEVRRAVPKMRDVAREARGAVDDMRVAFSGADEPTIIDRRHS